MMSEKASDLAQDEAFEKDLLGRYFRGEITVRVLAREIEEIKTAYTLCEPEILASIKQSSKEQAASDHFGGAA